MEPHRIDRISRFLGGREVSRRRLLGATAGGALAASGIAATAGLSRAQSATPAASPAAAGTPDAASTAAQAAAVLNIVQTGISKYALKAVIFRVTINGQELVTAALGESMTGVPATTDMHFRNGAVAIAYMATLLLRLVDQGKVKLDDKVGTWIPNLPEADSVTLKMLTNMTSGYPDYEQNPQLAADLFANPFRQFTTKEQLDIGFSTTPHFAPGTNWSYAHTNYVILGLIMAKVTGKPLDVLLQEQILAPLGLTNTTGSSAPSIPEPVLHAFSSERRQALGIPAGTRFYEEATFWNPSWSLAQGAIQTTNIYDMTASAEAIGTGTLLTPASYKAMVAPDLLGFGAPLKGCFACRTLNKFYNYGLGLVLSGNWLLQPPLFAGLGSVMAYLPSKRIAISVATTYAEESFDDQGNYKYGSVHQTLFREIGAYLAPDDAPPTKA